MLRRVALIVAAASIVVAVGAWTHGNVSVGGNFLLDGTAAFLLDGTGGKLVAQ